MKAEPIVLRQTSEFRDWFDTLRDRQARFRIEARLARVRTGNFGDTKSVGGGVSEMRIHYGAGYRLYFARRGRSIVLLLTGGDKATQQSDVRLAKALAASWSDSDGA